MLQQALCYSHLVWFASVVVALSSFASLQIIAIICTLALMPRKPCRNQDQL